MPKSPNQPNSGPKPLFQFETTDEGVVSFIGQDPTTGDVFFLDRGYMPADINSLTVKGGPTDLPSGLDGAFIHYYNGFGVQHMSGGLPTSADYTTVPGRTLHYELVGYKGTPKFLPGADATGEVTGIQQFVLAQGDLVSGHLYFTAGGFGGIAGDLKTTMQVGGKLAGELDLHITHTGFATGGDSQFLYSPASKAPIGVALDGGSATASFYPLHA